MPRTVSVKASFCRAGCARVKRVGPPGPRLTAKASILAAAVLREARGDPNSVPFGARKKKQGRDFRPCAFSGWSKNDRVEIDA